MTKVFFLMSFLALLGASGNPQDLTDDRTALLAGIDSKSWYLYSKTPEKPGATCQSIHAISLDNTYTFFADGTL